MSQPVVSASIMELLVWIAERPRTYAQAMDAWRSTCPRHSVWEDAVIAGLVQVGAGGGMDEAAVTLTNLGRSLVPLTSAARPPADPAAPGSPAIPSAGQTYPAPRSRAPGE